MDVIPGRLNADWEYMMRAIAQYATPEEEDLARVSISSVRRLLVEIDRLRAKCNEPGPPPRVPAESV
jgi:hypothetical protein